MWLLAKAPYKTVEFEGWEILIGRSSADNDILSLQVARPEDTWLHVANHPGSHVVIRNPERNAIPEHVLEEAGRLAIQNSKAKGMSGVEVVIGVARDLYKPEGAAVGQINLDRYRTRKIGHRLLSHRMR